MSHTLVLVAGRPTNLLTLTEQSPGADPQDSITHFTCPQATALPSTSPRFAQYQLPKGGLMTVQFETGNVQWDAQAQGEVMVMFDRTNANRRSV